MPEETIENESVTDKKDNYQKVTDDKEEDTGESSAAPDPACKDAEDEGE